MAVNGSIEDQENEAKAGMGILGLAALGILAAVGTAVKNGSEKEKQKQEKEMERNRLNGELRKVDSQIDYIDSQLADLRSGFLGSFLNSDQIDSLKAERSQLVAKHNQLVDAINGLE